MTYNRVQKRERAGVEQEMGAAKRKLYQWHLIDCDHVLTYARLVVGRL